MINNIGYNWCEVTSLYTDLFLMSHHDLLTEEEPKSALDESCLA